MIRVRTFSLVVLFAAALLLVLLPSSSANSQPLVNFLALTPRARTYLPIVRKPPPTPTPKPLPSSLIPNGDSYVTQGNSGVNYGKAGSMRAGRWLYDGRLITRSLLFFDLSDIPAGTHISRAAVRVYYIGGGGPLGIGQPVTAYRIIGVWNESTVNWSNQPSYAEGYGTLDITLGFFDWYEIDITALAQGWVNGTLPNYGVALRGTEDQNNNYYHEFYTREAFGGAGPVPTLELTY